MRLVLLGYPVGHSVSPAMHGAALRAAGLNDWTYTAWAVTAEELPGAVEALRGADYAGANVTVPHKTRVMALLDGLTPVARAIGAVNTIVKQERRLIGHNTDAAGLLADLHANGAKLERRPVLILGAGGSARAAAAACLGVGARVRVLARRPEAAEALRELGPVEVFEWSPLGLLQASDDCAVIINTTPLGMTPEEGASPWLEGTPFPPGALVYDLVYNPPETRLVRQARAEGLRAATGLGMLVEQGALAFELWTGRPAAREAMREAAREELWGMNHEGAKG
jgi:shikimate dehydrogenase